MERANADDNAMSVNVLIASGCPAELDSIQDTMSVRACKFFSNANVTNINVEVAPASMLLD
ncbi:hypothetical protein P154DRAFT_573560 [Amniculicola lignicola CBS 123094]|uniref:Uncharacterized protein n=1 Tax=Amniculicola lignicola CBS 123094 TaxID=1392246 RepID=A0A6A5WME0_9PLEO|nr:hypothetical protein P154DRAFT_573560 [Amniculicola lignicola CBS 123094]